MALSVDSSDGPLATTSTPLSATLLPLLTRRPAAPLPVVRMEPPDMFNELPPCRYTPCAFLPLVWMAVLLTCSTPPGLSTCDSVPSP
ncbi:Uncharacterised protein [Bordetella pertussis]|nr:Uncharacterised protein [Bordetella pertussis]CFL86086.1 Uncharacterised protein [Bordetella pertussis]CFL93761.1 Uncharacterised protein [Bordetella pertussis]CFM08561.1 Uncharacterised protein [Bordetella pertussis]CFM25725.1 Uncharacterised protein [Bordetella pertussis]